MNERTRHGFETTDSDGDVVIGRRYLCNCFLTVAVRLKSGQCVHPGL